MPRPHPSWGPEKDQEAERVVEETMRPLESSTRIPTLPKPANLNLGSSFKDSRVTNWLKSSTSTQNLIGPLDEISERLVTHGYAPLHHTLLTNPANNSQPGLTERQSRSLRQAFLQIFDDHDKKSRIIRDLSLKLEEEREETEKLRRQFSMLENNMKSDSEADLRIIQEQQELISSLKAEIASFDSSQRTLQRELEECKEETTALRRKLQQSEVKNQSVQAEIDDLKEKIEKRQILSEQSFADITNRHMKDPTKSGVDRLTLQVIDAYEKRLESLRSELKAERLRGSTRNGETDLNDEVLLKELIETRRNFENAVEDAAEARKELELARLKLLETKKPDWIAKTKQAVGEGLSTRELIRRDKQAWRMKLFYIDGMDIDECRQLLKEVCCKLAIPDVSQLIPGLSAIDATLRLLPQVQSFVLAINSLVHTHYLRFVTDEVTPADEAMKKLDELVDIVAMWGRSVEGIDRLRRFKQEMLRAVSVQDGPDAMDHCLDAIFKLRESYKELVNDAARKEQNTEGQAGRIVRHFMDLFDIPTMNDVLPMMNEIYVKWAERNAGIARLRSSLLRNNSRALGGARLDSDSPGRVMLKAAEIIETLAGEETTRGSTPYLQSLNK
ncbi:hypothetical protein DFJ73DRAFT_846485 [Zopfochytrium polystomum]|nr:hypothetical protein DFJ73DRAFT_846485 [Zopfochytrium polystomum]